MSQIHWINRITNKEKKLLNCRNPVEVIERQKSLSLPHCVDVDDDTVTIHRSKKEPLVDRSTCVDIV